MPMMKYQALKSFVLEEWIGSSSEAFSFPATTRHCTMAFQSNTVKNSTATMMTAATFVNRPCMKFDTITLVCPPMTMKPSGIATMSPARATKVEHCSPSTVKCSGSPMMDMKSRALTSGKNPKLIMPAVQERMPAVSRTRRS